MQNNDDLMQYNSWSKYIPNPSLSPEFEMTNNGAVVSVCEDKQIGFWKTEVKVEEERYYRLSVCFDYKGEINFCRNIVCTLEWDINNNGNEQKPQDIISSFRRYGEYVHGELLCKAPLGAYKAYVYLGVRYALGTRVCFTSAILEKGEAPKSRKVRLAVCSWNPTKENSKERYFASLNRIVRDSTKDDCDLLLLPEFCDQYQIKSNFLNCDDIESNETIIYLRRMAKESSIYICAPILERDGKTIYNTVVVIDRYGDIIGSYRKNHLYWPETFYWGETPGDSYPVFELDFGTIGIQTCYDNWNADVCKLYALKGAEIVLMPNEGYDPMIMPARAVDNRIFIGGSSLKMNGLILNPRGEQIVETKNGSVVAELDLSNRIPPYPVTGGSCNYAMGARRIVHNSKSWRVYEEILELIKKDEETSDDFCDTRSIIDGSLAR
jgi:predicted amidohydrolase